MWYGNITSNIFLENNITSDIFLNEKNDQPWFAKGINDMRAILQ